MAVNVADENGKVTTHATGDAFDITPSGFVLVYAKDKVIGAHKHWVEVDVTAPLTHRDITINTTGGVRKFVEVLEEGAN